MRDLIRFIVFLTIVVLPQSIQGQLLSVSGYIKNHISGQAIESAAIYESVSGIGTITNKDGYYRLLLNEGKQKLKISSIGYESVISEFIMKSDTIISIDMKPQNLATKVVAGNRQQNDTVDSEGKQSTSKKQK